MTATIGEWKFWPSFGGYWSLRAEWKWRGIEGYSVIAEVVLEPRPSYCDRGHWYAKVDGPLDIDDADRFPRYYMDLERAKAEMRDWLAWRIERQEKTA